jgi:hypothetical protein
MRGHEVGILGCAALAGVVGALLAGRSERGGTGEIAVVVATQPAPALASGWKVRVGGTSPGPAAARRLPFTSVRVSSSGHVWRYVVYRNQAGAWCSDEATRGGGLGSGCFTRIGGWANVRIEGYAPPSIVRLDVLGMDCVARPVALGASGAFLAVFDRHQLASGGWPYVLRGYDARGRIVDQVRIGRDATGSTQAPVAGITGPAAACASLSGVRDLGS